MVAGGLAFAKNKEEVGVFRVAGYFVGYLLIYGKEVINVTA